MKDDKLYRLVYVALVGLTLLTAASYKFELAPLVAVVFAVGVAAMKSTLIAYYFMHMREEPALFYGIAFIGILAVVILAIGIFPDVGLKLS